MSRSSKIVIPCAIGIGCLVLLFVIFMNHKTRHSVMAKNATIDVRLADAEVLEREIRVGLPLGSSLSSVEGYLSKRGIEFGFEAPSKTVYAIMRKMKGSSSFASKSLALRFHFDDDLKLKSIDSEVVYTGP